MQKPVFLFSIVSLFLAAAALAVRIAELNTVFDPLTGLTVFSPLTVIMIVIALIGAAFYVVFSIKVVLLVDNRDYITAFHPKSIAPFVVSIAAFLVMCIGAYFCYLTGLSRVSSAASGILALLAVLSGAAYFNLSFNAFKRRNHGDMMLSSVIDVVFLCYWTVVFYRQEAANPVLIDGMYDFLGLCAATLALFYTTGFTAERPAPRSFLLFSGLAMFFCIISLANVDSIAYALFYIVLIVRLFTGTVMFLINSSVKEDRSTEGENGSDNTAET